MRVPALLNYDTEYNRISFPDAAYYHVYCTSPVEHDTNMIVPVALMQNVCIGSLKLDTDMMVPTAQTNAACVYWSR